MKTVKIHNVETGEIIEREMTEEELAQQIIDQTVESNLQAQAEAKAIARQAILERLGLTEEEARLLLG